MRNFGFDGFNISDISLLREVGVFLFTYLKTSDNSSFSLAIIRNYTGKSIKSDISSQNGAQYKG